MAGFARAIEQAKVQYGISVYLILSFLRHCDEASAIETLVAAKPYYSMIKLLA